MATYFYGFVRLFGGKGAWQAAVNGARPGQKRDGFAKEKRESIHTGREAGVSEHVIEARCSIAALVHRWRWF